MQQVDTLELSIAGVEIDVAIQRAHQVPCRIAGEREIRLEITQHELIEQDCAHTQSASSPEMGNRAACRPRLRVGRRHDREAIQSRTLCRCVSTGDLLQFSDVQFVGIQSKLKLRGREIADCGRSGGGGAA